MKKQKYKIPTGNAVKEVTHQSRHKPHPFCQACTTYTVTQEALLTDTVVVQGLKLQSLGMEIQICHLLLSTGIPPTEQKIATTDPTTDASM